VRPVFVSCAVSGDRRNIGRRVGNAFAALANGAREGVTPQFGLGALLQLLQRMNSSGISRALAISMVTQSNNINAL
jgi:hypothetical protein